MNRAMFDQPSYRRGARTLIGAVGLLIAVSALGADAVPPTTAAAVAPVSVSPVSLSVASPPGAVASGNKLQGIDVLPLSGKRVQLTMHLSAPAPQPLSLALDKPARISFDLPNTTLSLPSRRIDVGAGGVSNIIAAEAGGRARVVLDLDQPMPYQTRINGDDIVVVVGASADAGGGTSRADVVA